MPEDYKPVPVDVARQISRQYAKQCVVIASYDFHHALTHITTYGTDADYKEIAASVGDRVGKFIAGDFAKTSYEDFRNRTEAMWATEKDHLLLEIERLRGLANLMLDHIDNDYWRRRFHADINRRNEHDQLSDGTEDPGAG